jgi:hypothetical protein
MSYDLYVNDKKELYTGLHYNIAGWEALLQWLEAHGVCTKKFPRGCSGNGEILSKTVCAKVADTIAKFKSTYVELYAWKESKWPDGVMPAELQDVSRGWHKERDFPNDDDRWRQPKGIYCA